MKPSLTTILIVLFTLSSAVSSQTFSIKNLKEVPKSETYVFTGRSTKDSTIPIVIKYLNTGTTWEVTGKMAFKDKKVEEEYTVILSNLLITDSKRTMIFPRGKTTTTSTMDVNIATNDPEEYIVSSIPAVMYVLRTFPFTSTNHTVNVRSPQQEKGHLNLRVKNKGLTKITTTKWGTVDAYHIELAVKVPVLGGFLPKLDFYFKNDAQKTLVAMKGMLPGSGNKIDVELTKYEKQ